ncbi:MAG: tRNA lysidine(34) synthetase TilS [Aestuariivirga sp.]|nr:tRNA lysidine(34) synthetase TilS [Aestuariivirga sp.]
MRAAEAELHSFTKQDCEKLFAALRDERHIAVAVSGGSDSMALLRLVEQWSRHLIKISVLTVDHGLRPEAVAEAIKVSEWCKLLDLEHHTLRWEGAKPKTGVQAKARAARYDLLSNWCKTNGVTYLLTGHTMDDQAETVLMRQQRTDTAESLAGIWETAVWDGVNVFRPLLGQSRADLRSYLTRLGQPWIEDPSNLDKRFERVRVRQTLAQGGRRDLQKIELADIAERAGRSARALALATEQWISGQLTSYPEGFGAIPRAGFCELDPALQRRVLQHLLLIYGAGNRAEPGELDYLAKWIMGRGISRRTLGGAMLACRQSSVLIGREWARISLDPAIVPDSGEILWDGRFLIHAPPQAQVVPVGRLHGVARREEIPSFVQQSLPAVLTGHGGAVIPHLAVGQGVSAKFIRHLR